MKIQVGQVKYKGRDDYRVVYGTTDAGKIYYFLDDNALANGNRIASTELVEAIDNTFKSSHIGVVDESGNEIIPFVNKTIKLISDGILLVEKVEPESDAVKQAISLRNDPTAATKLVSTPAAIKDKMAATMSKESRYVFNDLFSEAYICDLNANPLVDGLYSFIAIDPVNNKIYLSKNNPDEAISEFSIMPTQVNNNAVSDDNPIDVTSVNVSSDMVENALGNTQANNIEAAQAVTTDSIPAVPVVNEDATYQNNNDTVATSDSVVNNSIENPVSSDNGMDASTSQSKVYTPSPLATEEVIPPVLPDDLIAESQDNSQAVQEEAVTDEATLPVDVVNDVENTTQAISYSTEEAAASTDENMNSTDNGSSFFDSLSSLDTTPVSDEESDEIDASESNEMVAEESETPVSENTEDVKDDALANEEEVNESISQEDNDQEINSALVDINEESENEEENSEEEVAAIADVDSTLEEQSTTDESVTEEPVNDDSTGTDIVNETDSSSEEKVSKEEISEEVNDSDVVDDSTSLDNEDEIKLNIGEASPIEEVEDEKQEEEEATQSEPVSEVDSSDESEIEETPIEEAEPDEIVTDDGALEEVVAEPVEEIDSGYTYKDLGRDAESDIYKESIPSYNDSSIRDYSKEVNNLDKLIDNDYSSYGNLSSVKADRIDTRDDYFDIPPMAIQSERQDNIMEAVAKSMTELMRQNREQKVTIIQYHERLKRAESLKNSIAEKAKEQADLIKALSGKVRSLENTITKFETKSQLLESKVQDQDRIIAAQDRELKNLRPQVEGKEELAKLLKDARVLLNDSSENYEYEDSSYYGRRAA